MEPHLFDTVSNGPSFGRVFEAFALIFKYAPYWGPPVLGLAFWRAWMRYVRAQFIASQEYVLLELRLPQEIYKSPLAMQGVLDGLHIPGGESTFLDRILLGKVRTWFSLELVSIEGQVHFYIWSRRAFRRQVERNVYAYYPEVEVVEVEDYALRTPFTLEQFDMWGTDFKLSKPDAFPIKTYKEYGLDKDSIKEEVKTDPLTGLIEFLASMGKGEHMWIQVLVRAHKKEDVTFGFVRNEVTLEEQARTEIEKIRRDPRQTIILASGEAAKTLSDDQLTDIKRIHQSVYSANHFDTGVRGLYLAEKQAFDGTNIPALISAFKQFGAPGYNVISIAGNRWQPRFDYPWQDFRDVRKNKSKVEIIDAYRRRSWFHAPYKFRHFVLTSEELATIYHLPGSVSQAPTLQRVTSTRAEPPSNLPV